MESARERWAALTNAMLQARGRGERVDHRSYERQGIDREPGNHYGPAAAHMVGRGLEHDRLETAVDRIDSRDAIEEIDREVDALESSSRGAASGPAGDDHEEPEQRRGRAAPGRDEDLSPGR